MNPVIYIIIHNTQNLSYIGSTTNFQTRIHNHKCNSNKKKIV